MNKHTPGPWEHTGQGDIVGKEDNGYGLGYVDVCSVYLRAVRGRTNANARLIAAAPDLLEALEDALSDYDAWMKDADVTPNESLLAWTNKARAAIASARGEA